jgi:hypothetical protein
MYLLWKTEHKLVEQIETRYYLHFWQMSAVTEAHIIKTATTTIPTVMCLLYDVYKSKKRMSVIQI